MNTAFLTNFTGRWKAAIALALALSILALCGAALALNTGGEQAVTRSNTPIFFDQGGARLVVGSAGTLQVDGSLSGASWPGGSVSVSSGATAVTITHGVGITPSAVILTNGASSTVTPRVQTLNATVAVINFTADTGGTTATLYWQARR